MMGEFGRIDVIVNNAGISTIVPAEETTLADWERTLAVNLTGPFLISREFGKEMLRQGSGRIVNVSSVAGLLGISDRAAYNASKHGLIGLTRTLAAEWGGRGVRVNAISSGPVRTLAGTGIAGFKGLYGRFRDIAPLRRNIGIDDVGGVAVFLASELAGSITGEVLYVDAGFNILGVAAAEG